MHSKDVNQVISELNSSQNGINEQELEARKKQFGTNIIEKEKKKNFFVRFLYQFKNVMVIILLVSAIVSLSIAISHHKVSELIEGLVILFIVVMNAIVGVIQENKAEACLDELQKKTASHTKVIRDGKTKTILAEEVVKGDIVVIEAGDIVPADLRLIESCDLCCDESGLTGESVATEKNFDVILAPNTAINEQENMAFSGSMVTAGHGKGIAVEVGKNTQIGKIASILVKTKKELTPLQKSIEKIGKFITFSVLAVCVVIFALEMWVKKDSNFVGAMMTAVSLAVAAIPESLPAVITLIMAMGVQQLAKRKAIIKQLHAVETLGCCEIICSDKTGTLTQNKMQVVKVILGTTESFEKTSNDFNKLINCMYLCNEAKIENNLIVAKPTEKAIFEYALNHYDNIKRARVKEIAFNSNRKMMSTLNNDQQLTIYTKGAFDRVIKKCKYIQLNGNIVEIDSQILAKLNDINNDMANHALRVLAYAYKPCEESLIDEELEENLIFLGLTGLRDEPKVEVKSAINKCYKAGLTPIMITGDHKFTAFAIAKELNIATNISEVLTGDEINMMSEKEFQQKVKHYKVFARVSPEHKVKIVKAYKNLNKIVAMTGDGVNDAPSLKIADIGVGMGISGTEVVKSVSDMIITDDNFATIVVAVEEGRKVYNNIQKALTYLMSTNAVEIYGMLFSLIFFPSFTFLYPSQMLFINLVTDSLPAFALGVENVEPEIMTKPPRKAKSSIFAGDVGINIVYQAIIQMIIVTCVYCTSLRLYSPQIANSMIFFTIIWMQLLHSLNCKSNQSIIGKKLTDNRTFNICFSISLLINILVCVCPIFYTIFKLSYLNLSQWIWVAIASGSIIPLCEIFKFIINSNKHEKYIKNKNLKKVNN